MLHEGEITLINVCAPKQGATKYMKQLLKKRQGEADKKQNRIVGDLNSALTALDRSPKQEINKEISTLSDTLDQ